MTYQLKDLDGRSPPPAADTGAPLHNETFNDADRARSVEIYRRPMSGIADVIAAVVFGVLIGAGLRDRLP